MPNLQKGLIVYLLFILSSSTTLYAKTSKLESKIDCSFSRHAVTQQEVQNEMYVQIGDIEQWIAIRGKDCNNPVLLIIHGGPGSPWSHVTNNFLKDLEDKFTVVHWDQRGAGRTFGQNKSSMSFDDFLMSNSLTVEQMVKDGLELSQYLIERLGKRKIILRGDSWGAYLAINMINAKADLFHAYIGSAQLVNAIDSLKFGYMQANKIALLKNDKKTLDLLSDLGPPPYYHPGKHGRLTRLIKSYEREKSSLSSDSYQIIENYNNEKDQTNRALGDDYSWIYFGGFKKLGISGMLDDLDLEKLDFEFNVPIYIFQGAEDLITPPHITKAYFDNISAPKKEYFLIDDSGHAASDNMLDAQQHFLIDKILKIAKD